MKRQLTFPNIVEHAFALKVSREHLWRVLTGRRVSKSLLDKYEHLTATWNAPRGKQARLCPTCKRPMA